MDYFCFHSPFAKQVEKSFLNLLFQDLKQNIDSISHPVLKEIVSSSKDLNNRKIYLEF